MTNLSGKFGLYDETKTTCKLGFTFTKRREGLASLYLNELCTAVDNSRELQLRSQSQQGNNVRDLWKIGAQRERVDDAIEPHLLRK
jgi:hypothetical protein